MKKGGDRESVAARSKWYICCTMCNSKYLTAGKAIIHYKNKHNLDMCANQLPQAVFLDGNHVPFSSSPPKKQKVEVVIDLVVEEEKSLKEEGRDKGKEVKDKDNDEGGRRDDCCLCLEMIVKRAILLPCGHANFCYNCAHSELCKELCPMCKTPIERRNHVFL